MSNFQFTHFYAPDSTAIDKAWYNANNGEVAIAYASDPAVAYVFDVAPDWWDSFNDAASPGAFLYDNKPGHSKRAEYSSLVEPVASYKVEEETVTESDEGLVTLEYKIVVTLPKALSTLINLLETV